MTLSRILVFAALIAPACATPRASALDSTVAAARPQRAVVAPPRSPLLAARAGLPAGDERQAGCRGLFLEDDAILSPGVITRVEPIVVEQAHKSLRVRRTVGVQVELQPGGWLSRAYLARTLACHQERVAAGRVAPPANDPWSLPGGWIDFRIEPAGEGYRVQLAPGTSYEADRLLERAQAYAAGR